MGKHEDREFLLELGKELAGANPFSIVLFLYREWRNTQDIDRLLEVVDEREHKEFTAEIKTHLHELIEEHREGLEKSADEHKVIFRMLVNIQNFLESKTPQVVNRLDRMEKSPGRNVQPSPSSLLKARSGVVPFRGRGKDLQTLREWCDEEEEIAVRLYTGAGGMGKTRFMMKACEEARERGWFAGFLKDDDDTKLGEFSYGSQKSVLVVLDYAERRGKAVQRLLKGFLADTEAPKVRVVLLARSEADWWETLQGSDSGLEDVFHTSKTEALEAPSGEDFDPEQSYREAAQVFAKRLEKEISDLPLPDLSKPEFGRILILHMAALSAVYGDDVEGEASVFLNLGRREERYLEKSLGESSLPVTLNRTLFQAMTLATLLGGLKSRNDLLKVLQNIPLAKKRLPDEQEGLAALLIRIYPSANPETPRYLCGIEPDPFGEFMVCRWLKHGWDDDLLPLAIEEDWGEEAVNHSLTVLTRIAQRYKEKGEPWLEQTLNRDPSRLIPMAIQVAQETGDPIGRVAAKVLEAHPDRELALRMHDDLPFQTTALRELALVVTKILYNATKVRLEKGELGAEIKVALYSTNLGERHAALGHREEALKASEEAVTICRKLAEKDSEAFSDKLAGCLSNLGNRYSDLGNMEEALETAEEAVKIYRELDQNRPKKFSLYLATSLNNLGNRYSDFERNEEALKVTKEVVEIYQEIRKRDPDAFLPVLPDLAMSYDNLGIRYAGLGRLKKALEATEEAIKIYERLVRENPDAFLPELAKTMINLGATYSSKFSWEEARKATEKAIEIYRELAATRPKVFLPELARSLYNLADQYSALGQREKAQRTAEEAVKILSPFFQKLPLAHGKWMWNFVQEYQGYCKALNQEPDEALLAPILEIFEKLNSE